MTTTVNAFSSYVHDGCKVQVVLRYPATGAETVLVDSLSGHIVTTHHIWDGAELVFRELPALPPEPKTPVAAG